MEIWYNIHKNSNRQAKHIGNGYAVAQQKESYDLSWRLARVLLLLLLLLIDHAHFNANRTLSVDWEKLLTQFVRLVDVGFVIVFVAVSKSQSNDIFFLSSWTAKIINLMQNKNEIEKSNVSRTTQFNHWILDICSSLERVYDFAFPIPFSLFVIFIMRWLRLDWVSFMPFQVILSLCKMFCIDIL